MYSKEHLLILLKLAFAKAPYSNCRKQAVWCLLTSRNYLLYLIHWLHLRDEPSQHCAITLCHSILATHLYLKFKEADYDLQVFSYSG